MKQVCAHLILRGIVQGVGFRYFAMRWAQQLKLTGWVRNNWDGSVETEIEGNGSAVEEYIAQMKIGPRASHVTAIEVEYKPYTGKYTRFDITR